MKPVLGYWSVRGLGAQIRYILKHCQVDFEEELFPQTFDENAEGYDRWNRDEWMKRKFELGLDFPNLPFFIDGDVKLVQASAIQRYICHKWKPELLGRTPTEVGYAAMLEGQLSDLNGALDKIAFFPDGTREALKECTQTRLEPIYKFLGEKPFLVGEHVTFVDFVLFEMLVRCRVLSVVLHCFLLSSAYLLTIRTIPLLCPSNRKSVNMSTSGMVHSWPYIHYLECSTRVWRRYLT